MHLQTIAHSPSIASGRTIADKAALQAMVKRMQHVWCAAYVGAVDLLWCVQVAGDVVVDGLVSGLALLHGLHLQHKQQDKDVREQCAAPSTATRT
jgi:hypothetical protein